VNDLLKANEENTLGRTVVYVLKESELLGFISVGDVIRDSAIEAVETNQETWQARGFALG
jgi:cation transport ATPase